MSDTTAPAQPMPETPAGVIPYLCVSDARAAIRFYEEAFGARLLFSQEHEATGRLIHAALDLNGGRLFLADDFPDFNNGKENTPETYGGSPVTLHIQVDNVDATVVKAVEMGASMVFPVTDMFWGDRFGKLRDPFGHEWSVATPIKALEAADDAPSPSIA